MNREELRQRLREISAMTGITDDVRHALKMNACQARAMVSLRRKLADALANAEANPDAVVWAKYHHDRMHNAIVTRGAWHYIPMPADTKREDYHYYRSYWLD